MNKLILALVLASSTVSADTLVREGATCDIPEGYNSAPYSQGFNGRGMEPFCVFPAKPFVDGLVSFVDACKSDKPGLDFPICVTGLSLGGNPVYPCYTLVEE